MRTIADDEPICEALPPPSLEIVYLAEQHGKIDHHALPEHAARPLPEDPTREEPDDDLFVSHDEGMAGVRASAQRTTRSANSV